MRSNIILLVKLVEIINTESSLSDLAAYHANSAYSLQFVTTVVWFRTKPEDVTYFLKHFHGSVVTAKMQNNNNHKTRELNKAVGYKQTVLFAVSAEEFAYFITSVNLDLVVPIRLLLVLTSFVEDLSEITRIAWENDVADLVVISQDKEGNVSLATYFPYGKGICGDYTPVALKIDSAELFPKKFGNFYGCPVKVALVNFSPYLNLELTNNSITSIAGIDGKILIHVIEKLNATIDIVSIEDREGMGSFINGTPTGCFGDLVNKKADMIAPAAVINLKRYSLTQISHVYATLDVHWCAPSRRIMFTWAKVLLPLFDYITMYMFITFAAFVIVTVAIKRHVLHKFDRRNNVFFQTFALLMGQVVKFETESCMVNSLFIIWVWFGIIFRIAYQCDLIEAIHGIIQEPPFDSLENALEAVDGYGGLEVFYEFYKDSPLGAKFKILELRDLVPYIKDVAQGKRLLILTDLLLLSEFDAELQILNEPVSRAATCLFMRPGWPAAKEVDLITQYVIEMGLTVQVLEEYHYEWEKTRQIQKEEHVHPPLDFLSLSACFYGLMIMWIITTIIFILELAYSNKQKNNK